MTLPLLLLQHGCLLNEEKDYICDERQWLYELEEAYSHALAQDRALPPYMRGKIERSVMASVCRVVE